MCKSPEENVAYEFALTSPGVLSVSFILIWWFARWEVSGRTVAVLWGTTSKICSKEQAASLCISNFFSKQFIRVQGVQLYNSTDMATTWKNSCLFYQQSDFHMAVNLSIVVDALPMQMVTLFSVDEILLPRYMNWSTNFRVWPFNEKMVQSWLRGIKLCFTWVHRDQCLWVTNIDRKSFQILLHLGLAIWQRLLLKLLRIWFVTHFIPVTSPSLPFISFFLSFSKPLPSSFSPKLIHFSLVKPLMKLDKLDGTQPWPST